MQHFGLRLGLVALAVLWSGAASARFGSRLDYVTFRERCVMYREAMHFDLTQAPAVGTIAYFPTGSLDAGQTRFSFVRLRKAMRKAIKGEKNTGANANYDKTTKNWTFVHDDGQSLFPIRKKTAGVYYRGRIFIVDGHHRALISTYLLAPRVPVEIVADWSHLSPEDFRKRMGSEPHHFAHWRDYRGDPVKPVDLCALENDPNLLLARLLLYRVDVRTEFGEGLTIEDGRGAERPIAIKINHDIPFFEFEIADALRRAGVSFDDKRREHDLSNKELRYYLKILKAERDRPGSRLQKILLLDKPTTLAKLDLPKLIMDHVHAKGCHEFLTTKSRGDD